MNVGGQAVERDEQSAARPVRVLISYAHDDEAHKAQVASFWIFLRSQGIDARFDGQVAHKQQEWPRWMSRQLRESQFILVIASPEYRRRAEGRAPIGTGLGVAWESRQIMDLLYRYGEIGLPEVAAVVLPGGSERNLPDWLTPASRTWHAVTDFTIGGAESLLRLLTGQDYAVDPPVGPVPVLPLSGSAARGRVGTLNPEYYLQTFQRQYESFDALRQLDEPPIIEALARQDLYRSYVPLECVDGIGNDNDLDNYVRKWLGLDSAKSLVVLGEYGYGKTSYCLNLTYNLLRDWQSDSKNYFFPIYLSFRDMVPTEGGSSPETFNDKIVGILRDRYRLFGHGVELRDVVKKRKLLLVLDGLDEIEKSLSVEWIGRQFRSINSVTDHFAKVLVTCRISYLSNADDVRHVMSRDQYQIIVGSVARENDLEIVTLKSFDRRKKEQYVEQVVSDPEQRRMLMSAIDRIPDLPDLTTRPVLLHMVVSTFLNRLVDLNDLRTINAAQLYDRFTTQWLVSELTESHIGRDVLENQQLMHRLALKIYQDSSEQIQRDELLRELRITYPAKSDAQIVKLAHEFVVCSFFRPAQVNHYGFVHRSFLEFFVARAYLDYIKDGRPEPFGRERLKPGLVIQFLGQLIEAENANYLQQTLAAWLQDAESFVPGQSRLAANAATVLCQLGFRFRELDLSGVDLRDANLSGGDFRGTNLRGARLDNVLLEGTKLSDSDLRDADMPNVFVWRTDFSGSDLNGARFKNPRIVGGPDTIWIALYSRDTRHVVIGTDRGHLVILENEPPYRQVTRRFVHGSGVMHLAFSPDGRTLAVTNRSREIYLYDWDGLLQGSGLRPVVYADNANYVRWVEFSPDGGSLASGARDLMVKIWSLGEDSRVTNLKFHVRDVMCVTWSPNGEWLASAGYDATIALWNATAQRPVALELRDRSLVPGRPAARSPERQSHRGPIRALAFSTDGTLLASSSEDRTIKLWDLADPSYPTLVAEIQTERDVFCLAYVDAGACLLAGDSGGVLYKIDLEQRSVANSVRAHGVRIRSVDLNRDRTVLLTASWDGSVRSWNVSDLSPVDLLYRLDAGDVVYEPADAFLDANIGGVLELENQFREYFRSLGAIEDLEAAATADPTREEPDNMTISETRPESVLDVRGRIPREVLHEALRSATEQAWYGDAFHRAGPGVVPADFAHFGTLLEAGIISADGVALLRVNDIGNSLFVTDGKWRWNGAFHFVDESKILLAYCREHDLVGFDAVVEPGAGCGHTVIAMPDVPARYSLDVDARATEFAELNAWLNDCDVTVIRNDIVRGLPSAIRPERGRRVLFVANMPFAISPYAGALAHTRDGGETGIRLSLAVLDALRPFVGTGSKLVILTYSLGRSADQSWQFVERARELLPDCEQRWTMTADKIWRIDVDKVAQNPMPLRFMRQKAFSALRTPEDQRQLRDGYDKLGKELESLGWDVLGCGILEVTL